MIETPGYLSDKLFTWASDATRLVNELEEWVVTVTNKDEIKDRVLTENTAQGILNHLRELESNRARMQRRWIWELLQNARDAAVDDDTHLVASVELGYNEIVFQHNGRGFTMEEVAHLIYHGSTKLEDEQTIGQYGSGFLTTHLLSPVIDVSGQLNDRRAFKFRLKREISSAKALSNSMDQAWNDFDTSAASVSDADTFTTRFRYPIGEDAVGAVEEGMETLKRCAPFVVVFNRQFRRIDIESADETTTFEVVERIPLQQEGLQTVTVGVNNPGILREIKYLLAEGERVSVTVPMEQTDNGSVCLPLGNIPRLFLGFPLIGTETFSFPAVINSFAFTPTEHRNGVFLAQSDNAANLTNQAIVEEACELQVRLIEFVTSARWTNTHTLAYIPSISDQDWLNRDWLHNRLGRLIAQIRQAPTVLSVDGPMLPKGSILPLAEEALGAETLWDLLSKANALRQRLPERSEAVGWRDAVESWAGILDDETTSFDEGWDGGKLVSYIEETAMDANTELCTLERLDNELREDVDPVEWLNQLYRFLKDDGLDNVIRECQIVLGQAGYLDKLSNLYRDNDIDNELKAIGDDVLNLRIRGRLRDTRLTSLADELGKGEHGNKEVVQDITDKLQGLCNEDTLGDEFTQASPRLLAWLVNNQQWTHLTGFPAFSIGPDDGSREVLWLGQKGSGDVEVPLAPIKAWAEDLQQYADLFPWRHIMANDFFAVMPSVDVWHTLSGKGYVRTDVVVNSEKSLRDFLPDEPLPDGEHKTVDAVAVTDVILLAKDRVGIMARARDSQARARLFWRFLTEWLVTRDPEGLEVRTANCECGDSHRYFQAMWLVPVVRNSWVPQGNDIRDRATAQSLAKLLRSSGWTPNSLSYSSTTVKLLEAIRVTRFDLMRHFVVSDDEARSALDDTMTSILVSTGGDLGHVRDFVEDMKSDKDLPKHLAERRERRRIVHENQRLGDHVEDLVREGLEDQGFNVKRTGIGSDFEIEYDLIEENEEIGIELSLGKRTWLVEVKATREQRVRMTAKQAETAVKRGEGFLLCVVPLGHGGTNLEKDDIRTNMRFVQNIGPRVEPLCAELDALNELRDDATTPSISDIQLEIEAGTARIRVDNAVWQNGVCLSDLPAQLK